MIQQSYRDTWAEISLEAITYNTEQFKKHIGENVKLMAVVKADGYGHGSFRVAKAALLAGAEYLAVALLDEALELRQAGINEPILVLGYTPARSVKKAILGNIELTVFSKETLQEIINQSREMKRRVAVHLKIDTGMTRIGVQTKEEALTLVKMSESADNVLLKGIFTHFANADSEDPSYTAKQFSQFQTVVSFLEKNKIHIPFKHCCNTAATMSFPAMHLDMVRVGIGLYGLYPDASLKKHTLTLKQAMTLKTKIASLKIVPANQPISYGCTYLPPKESVIATLPIGYADGLSRLLSNRGQFLVKGQKAPIVGRVCMDQTMIDVSDIPSSQFDDEAVIFGQNGNAFQEIDEIARIMETINYEVVCLVGKRVPRVYLDSNRNSSTGSLGSSLLEYV
ncbi:alanine racemase [Bacillus sp. FJAT-18017]|uniref:alanine racemase n=1 Tax=Bacillus sp. FJAT-18017 TaxID=1705566 RepID=UPI0006AF7E91|nr:alanine racemase [Bacillus sp. FJAT-18017]ALC90719.1 alanine racemase [Bacillus sp. FJAT-18017]